ncbi:hypothetical protein AK812_SmicGene2764 [Symbiodinium microadriaticum]|uniref:Uncharacterized protein n=1 Tax=Symbiodinium microadriaticum TaxID=2951 RepID=A0A1Q9F0L6_SYMMI|nr:hypothetical protein AK812_SmicGene2764 [Symbiodinium microadriaticum]
MEAESSSGRNVCPKDAMQLHDLEPGTEVRNESASKLELFTREQPKDARRSDDWPQLASLYRVDRKLRMKIPEDFQATGAEDVQDPADSVPIAITARALLDYFLVANAERILERLARSRELHDRIPEGLAEELESSGTLWGALSRFAALRSKSIAVRCTAGLCWDMLKISSDLLLLQRSQLAGRRRSTTCSENRRPNVVRSRIATIPVADIGVRMLRDHAVEISTLGGATNLVNAPAWLGNVTWDLLAGTNTVRNLHATGPLSIQLANDDWTLSFGCDAYTTQQTDDAIAAVLTNYFTRSEVVVSVVAAIDESKGYTESGARLVDSLPGAHPREEDAGAGTDRSRPLFLEVRYQGTVPYLEVGIRRVALTARLLALHNEEAEAVNAAGYFRSCPLGGGGGKGVGKHRGCLAGLCGINLKISSDLLFLQREPDAVTPRNAVEQRIMELMQTLLLQTIAVGAKQ